MQITYETTWDLDTIFQGGSESGQFNTYLDDIKRSLRGLSESVMEINPHDIDADILTSVVNQLEYTTKRLGEAFAFISCLSAQNVKDAKAGMLVGKRSELKAEADAIKTNFDQKIMQIDDKKWENLLTDPILHEVAFVLNEARQAAKDQLPVEQEVLMNDLAIDGYQGWSQMYDTVVGNMGVELEVNGVRTSYSMGQASNKLSDPNRAVRKHAAEQIDKEWKANAELLGQTLNHLAGFRLQKYKHRKWADVLKEPLAINRMKQETLDAMWKAISRNKQPFVQFLQRKAELLGREKLSMYDIGAPISDSVKMYSFSEGADFIVEQFRTFSPKMADFAQMAFEKRWIEAEDRAGKRTGGFCTSFPDSEQTRIFMTFSGTSSNVATLAHELGHAYHQHVMNDIHGLNQGYAMNVAETASTFAEMIVADASVKQAKDKHEKKALLEDKVQRGISFFMNIHARFLFESRFYEERKQGMVTVERLNELMVDAQKEAYCDELEDYDEKFWASKLHFHITGVPFYNFPYTFGYLFSLGLYAHALESDGNFEDDYAALLRDTGRMNVEELAEKHLNVDFTKPDFWENAMKLCIKDVEEFLAIS
ncbi:oligoendopeptidase [Virgibacillus phasianinus]|uniref:Oligoendopeptidase n=1 Tax=Virgibacillus phasianinus TaxID=2017483 RepID=A0A220U6H3_9BACI|nr:M3 family oligoendopeptidase [Virgibacillus phasianinus]ASK63690.1 oligoendopeptidase [Virgibacillus phasianinus]